MGRKNIVSWFYTEDSAGELSLEDTKRIPFMVYTNIAMFPFFTLSAGMRFVADPARNLFFLLGVLGVSFALLPAALISLRRGRYRWGSYFTSAAVLLNVNAVSFLQPVTHEQEIYRTLTFLLAFLILNSLTALSNRQVFWFGSVGSVVSFLGYVAIRQIPYHAGPGSDIPALTVIGTISVVTVAFLTHLLRGLTGRLVGIVEEERHRAQHNLDRLQQLVADSRQDLEIGSQLQETASLGMQQGKNIQDAMQDLARRTTELQDAMVELAALNREMSANSNTVDAAMQAQGSNMEETSASIVEINATVQSLSSTSSEKQGLVDTLSRQLVRQESHVQTARTDMERVQASSRDMTRIINLILDTSEQTGILAMNASIEAAHAGAEGRGFAVIAGEIRKLAEESRSNADKVTRAIQANNQYVQSSMQSFEGFTAELGQVNARFQEVLRVLDVVSSGLAEISTGTQQIQEATQRLVESSDSAHEAVDHTRQDVERQEAISRGLREYAERVGAQVDELTEASRKVSAQLEDIHSMGRENAARMTELNRELTGVSRG